MPGTFTGAGIFGSLLPARLMLFSAALCFMGCASPSEPIERKPPTPAAVTDLAAEQSGDNVVLTFTLPKDTVDHRPLADTPAIEIYRDVEAPAEPGQALAAPAHPTLLATIPAAMTLQYAERGHVRYADALTPSVFAANLDGTAVYVVRTRVSEKRSSANSNPVALHVFPVAEAVADLKAEVTHSGINLTWTAADKDLAGNRPAITGYRIYRSAAPGASSDGKPGEARMARIADVNASSTTYLDTQINFGDTYTYAVRSVVSFPGEQVESADSNAAVILAKDTFPPAAPENLVVAVVPAQPGAAAHLELSWQISPEPDVAGYYLYRSDQSGTPGTRQTTALLLTPAFRDMNVVSGKRYFYSVTAVDRSGNESSPSTSASGEVP